MKLSSYLAGTMARDEEILTTARLHKIVYFPAVFFMFLGLIAIIAAIELTRLNMVFNILYFIGVMFLFIGAIDIWRNKCCEMIGTSKRVIIKRGIFSIKTSELRNDRIESVSVNQTLIGRVLGYGDVWFSGTGTTRVLFHNIAKPVDTKIAFEELIAQSNDDAI